MHHFKVFSLLVVKYPLKQYCDDWKELVTSSIQASLKTADLKLLDLLPNEGLRRQFRSSLQTVGSEVSYLYMSSKLL